MAPPGGDEGAKRALVAELPRGVQPLARNRAIAGSAAMAVVRKRIPLGARNRCMSDPGACRGGFDPLGLVTFASELRRVVRSAPANRENDALLDAWNIALDDTTLPTDARRILVAENTGYLALNRGGGNRRYQAGATFLVLQAAGGRPADVISIFRRNGAPRHAACVIGIQGGFPALAARCPAPRAPLRLLRALRPRAAGRAGARPRPGRALQGAMPSPFARHIAACNNLASPAHLVPFRIAGQLVGWLSQDLARALAFWPRAFHFDAQGVSLAARLRSAGARSDALAEVCRSLAGRGFFRLRGEAFDLRARTDGPVLATLDRGALPAFGAISQGVHVNGLVRRADGLHLWVGWRSRAKSVAPGQLDNLVAGGIPAGLSVEETLVKEAEEEASVPPALAVTARRAGRVSYVMAQAEGGLRRDVLHCYDLDLPEGFEPRPNDDEVERFELWPARRLLELVRDTDGAVKFNVNLVLIDLFLREGLIDPESQEGRELRAGLDQGPD